jgi:hypothetical protein
VQSSSSIKLRSPGALAAAIPSLVGFHPTDSLVAVFLAGGTVIVTMRIDVPLELSEVADYVASTGVKVKADEVIVVLCCPKRGDELPHELGVDAVIAACEEADLLVRDVLLIDQGRYWSYMCQNDACCSPEGTPIPANELLEAERVGQGLLTSADSRAALIGRYAPHPDLAPRDAAAEAGARILEVPVAERAERVWDAVQMLARHGAEPTDVDGILRTRVSIAVRDVRVRDYVLGRMAEADEPQPLLDALVRVALTAPEADREPVAAMTAAALAALGESTVAVRCLLDLAGDQSLGQLVAACIQVPVPPSELRRLLVEAMPQVQGQLARATAGTATPESQPEGTAADEDPAQ